MVVAALGDHLEGDLGPGAIHLEESEVVDGEECQRGRTSGAVTGAAQHGPRPMISTPRIVDNSIP
jgi:hypothetical protein